MLPAALQMWDLYQRQLIDTKVDIWVSSLHKLIIKRSTQPAAVAATDPYRLPAECSQWPVLHLAVQKLHPAKGTSASMLGALVGS